MPSLLDSILRRVESLIYGTVLIITAAIGDDDASDHDPLATPLGVSTARVWAPTPTPLPRAG